MTTYPSNNYVLGYKGRNPKVAGIVYVPYMPLMSTDTISGPPRPKRRYREKNYLPKVCCTDGYRLEDEVKGWGTLSKDGSILWDTWRPPSKKPKHSPWTIKMPMFKKAFPTLISKDIVGVQPMSGPTGTVFHMEEYAGKIDKKLYKKVTIKV